MKTWPAITPIQVHFNPTNNEIESLAVWTNLVQKKVASRPKPTGGLSRRSSSARKVEPSVAAPAQIGVVESRTTTEVTNKTAWRLHLDLRNGNEEWVTFENLNGLYDNPAQDPFLENLIHQYFFPVNGEYVLMYRPLETHAVTLVNSGVHLDDKTLSAFPHLKERWEYLIPTAQRTYMAPGQ